jgi:hypothetical protein
MSSLEVTDAESKAVAVAPRVSLDDIKANILGEYYCTGMDITTKRRKPHDSPHPSVRVLTVCLLVLRNGFTVIGKAAPASEANFNRDLGQKFAYEDAVRQVWPLMGYALRQRQLDLATASELPKEKP